MSRIRIIGGLAAALGAGWIGGVCYERSPDIKGFSVSAASGPVHRSTVVPAEPSPGTSRSVQIMRFGFPSHDNIKTYDDYVLSYDRRNRTANWVFEHLTKESLKPNDGIDRTKCYFKADLSVHPHFRAENSDYLNSGYDRGHLAAASNHRRCQEDVQETFTLSNISPQVGEGFNRGIWNNLERYVRGLTKRYKNVYVCTGPLYLPRTEADGKIYVKYEVIGPNHVAVPTHFFKVIVGETCHREYEMECYVMPNRVIDPEVPLQAFLVPLDSIERAAGMLFFDKIPQETFKMINGRRT